ncbi:MAG: hypothetical protein GC161_12645 [Planctomycetaceae bacterium]|nr:hypothetical protein [Planctomycetaceae bacterium]
MAAAAFLCLWAPVSPAAWQEPPAGTAEGAEASHGAAAEFLRRVQAGSVPRGALESVPITVRGSARDMDIEVGGERAPFRWRLRPGATELLDLVEVLDLGWVQPALPGAQVVSAAGASAMARVERDGGALLATLQDGTQARFEAQGRSLRIDLSGPAGVGREVNLGALVPSPDVALVRVLPVPYADQGAVCVFVGRDGAVRYLTAWFDPVHSNATRIDVLDPDRRTADGGREAWQRAIYVPNTAGDVRPLAERIWLTWSDDLLDVLPSQDRPASPDRARAGERYYLDYNATPFDLAKRGLEELAASGVRDLFVWMRHWQKDGYDTGYPTDVLPPREMWGGEAGLLAVREAARAAGFGFALHHNWAFNSEGREGWDVLGNTGEPRTVPDGGRFLKSRVAAELAPKIEAEFHRLFDTEGSYSDSIGAIHPPVDLDADEPGWGFVRAVLSDWHAVLDTLRRVHGGPVASEGSLGLARLYWTGEFDVTHGYPGYTTANRDIAVIGRNMTIVPDYVLGTLHGKDVRAGLGDPPRFVYPAWDWKGPVYEPAWRDELHTLAALYGAAGYTWWYERTRVGDAARDWWATAAPAQRLAHPDRRPTSIRYRDPMGRWVDLAGALAQGMSFRRGETQVRVEASDGSIVWANLTPNSFDAEVRAGRKRTIAPWGRLVQYPDLEAGLVEVAGDRYEVLRAPDRFYMDSRGAAVEREQLRLHGALGMELTGQPALYPMPEYLGQSDVEGNEVVLRTERIGLGPSWVSRLAQDPWATRFELELVWDGPGLETRREIVRCDLEQWLELDPARWLEDGYRRLRIVHRVPADFRPRGH